MRRAVVIPLAIYAALFTMYTWPWVPHFGSHLWSAGGDAHQGVWNLWWFDHAITSLQRSPFHTDFVHFPHGTSLVAQTLSPLNGLLGIGLLRVMSPVQAYNLLVGLSFVVGGLTAFHLCWAVTARYGPSLVGGFVFTFSTYHFAHAFGHLNLVSIQFIPLFVLAWRALLRAPSYRLALASAAALFAVSLCDLNLALYCVIAGVVMLAFPTARAPLAALRRPMALFVGSTLATTAVLPIALFVVSRREGFTDGHNAEDFSADAFLAVLGGGLARFDLLTGWAWDHLSNMGLPERADLGFVVVALLVVAVLKRGYRNEETPMWLAMTAVFYVFALGPRLILASRHLPVVPLPYAALELLPGVGLSGVPIRMMGMACLPAGVVVATVLAKIDHDRRRLAVGAVALVLAVLAFPISLPESTDDPAGYVHALRATGDRDPVLDLATNEVIQLFHQTFDEHPRAFGYLTRTFPDVARQSARLRDDVERARYDRVCRRWGIRYVAAPANATDVEAPEIYRGPDAVVYDLSGAFGSCVSRDR